MFRVPIRTDIVNFVHTNIRKNRRQPFGVSKEAGMCFTILIFCLKIELSNSMMKTFGPCL